MNKTLQVVQEWVDFEEQYPKATLEDFCRHYLSAGSKKIVASDIPCSTNYHLRYSLTKVINRLSKLWMYFTLNAMKPMGLSSFDEFIFLYTVENSKAIRKKDLIYMHFIEISSGLLVIDRLIKKGFLEEKMHEQDKRSKQVYITKKGKETLKDCHFALNTVAEELYGEMPDEEMDVCLQYLTPVESKIAQKWHHIKKFEPVIV